MRAENALRVSALHSLPEIEPGTIAAVRERLVQWLLGPGVQLTGGRHAGGVAGRLDPDGHAQYVYPEITGYYLQWLASLSSRNAGVTQACARADAAQRWLCHWVAMKPAAPTRV